MELPSTTPLTPAGVVAGARVELAGLGEVLWAAKTPGELIGTVEELEALRAQLAALEASVLVEVEARKVARTHLSWGSTSDWFTHLAGTHRGPGHRAVRQAPVLVGELPRTHAALAEGTLSPEQASVIVDAIDQLPHRADLREQGEEFLLDQATRLNATELAKAAKHLLEVADPEQTERDAEKAAEREARAAHLGRFLAITQDGAGGVRVRGRGTVEDATWLGTPRVAGGAWAEIAGGHRGRVGPRAPPPRQSNLDVGRTHRLVTPAIWRALVCRDVHCAFPGCTRPPVMGHAHHIIHWLFGGPTALDNLASRKYIHRPSCPRSGAGRHPL